MTVSLQHFGDNASYPLLIIDDQYASGKITDLLIQRARIALIAFDVRQHNLENAPFARLAFHFYLAANSHRVERVQDHIDEYFTQLGGLSPHQQIFARLQLQFDLILDTEGFRVVTPSRARNIDRISHDIRKANHDQIVFVCALACEVLYSLDHASRI